MKNNKKSFILVLSYFIFATAYITHPLLFNLSSLTFESGDVHLITWILNWDIHALLSNPLHIFQANIYYPYANTLAFSDAFITSAIIGILPVILTKEPLVAFNINYLFTLTSLGFCTFLLVRYMSSSIYAGIISGTLVAYSTYTLTKYMHLQVISIQWIPISLLFFFLYIKKIKFRYLVLSAFFFVVQIANSFLPGYFLLLCFTIFLFSYFLFDKKVFALFSNKKVFVLVGVVVFCSGLLALPYYKVSKEFGYVRDIRDTIHFANRPEYFFYSSDQTRLYKFLLNTFYSADKGPYFHHGYIGFPLLALSLFSFLYWVFHNKDSFYPNTSSFWAIAITAYTLSLGPALQWRGSVIKDPFLIPLPYAVLYYAIPGFKGFRNSARWEMLWVFALAVLCGLIIGHIMKKADTRYKIVITFLICFSVLLEFNFPFAYKRIQTKKEFPAVYAEIAKLPKSTAIVELPIYNWDMHPFSVTENKRLYYSTAHFKKTMNGGSGFSPPVWQKTVKHIVTEFPDKATINYLKKLKITHILIHTDEYTMLAKSNIKVNNKSIKSWRVLEKEIQKYPEVKLINAFNTDLLYSLENK